MSSRCDYKNELARDSLRWLDLGFAGVRKEDADRQGRTVRRIVRGLYRDGIPGMILGDEVGMGKTYETFGVIAALFRHNPRARIAVLTHSATMAQEWRSRWMQFTGKASEGDRSRDAHGPGAVSAEIAAQLPDAAELEGAHQLGERGLAIGSYETIKCISSDVARGVLERSIERRWLRKRTLRRLRKALFGSTARYAGGLDGTREPSRTQLNRIWNCYDGVDGWNSQAAVLRELRRVAFQCARTKKALDLLVVDEAHKLAGVQRRVFFQEVLGGRSERALYVTATPFALDVSDLFDRIQDIFGATGRDVGRLEPLRRLLDQYRECVEARQPLPPAVRRGVQYELGQFLVRSTWSSEFPGTARDRRKVHRLVAMDATENEAHALAALVLERAFYSLERGGGRTHRAVHRETLCSSHAAIRDAAERSERGSRWPSLLAAVPPLLPPDESPKFQKAVSFLIDLARRREKVVVFCKRLATIDALAAAIQNGVSDLTAAERQRWKGVQPRASELDFRDRPQFRLAVHLGHRVSRGAERQTVAKVRALLSRVGGNGTDAQWDATWGPRRRVEWVAKLTGETRSNAEQGRSIEDVIFSFNLPGPPYVVLCTGVAREGIDLHRWCRRVLHYDLEWNPAYAEQEVGRVDRMQSLSWRETKPVEIFYVWQSGTYEERIADAVERRLAMMRTLLGAGEWLAADAEGQESFDRLDEYRLDFTP